MADTNMRRTMRQPTSSTQPSNKTGRSYPPVSLLNPHVARPSSPLPSSISKGPYASTDRSPEAQALRATPASAPSTMRFTSASAAVAAARVLTAHESTQTMREPRRARPTKEGRHLAQAKGKDKRQPAAPTKPSSSSSSSSSSPSQPAVQTKSANNRPLPPVSVSAFRPPLHDDQGVRFYGISGEGVRVGTATPPRTPTVLEGRRDVPSFAARFESAPPDGRRPGEATGRGRQQQDFASFELERKDIVSLQEPEKWSANVTAPLPRLEPKLSRPVLRAVVRPNLEEAEKKMGEERRQKALRREGSLKKLGKAVSGVFKKGHSRSSSAVSADSRPGTADGSVKSGSGRVLKRSGSFVDRALDFFAPDRHEVMAAGSGHGLKGRIRVKAGLPAEAGSKTRLTGRNDAKVSHENAAMEPKPKDDEIWGFSQEMSDRLESMERMAEAAKARDEEYRARKKETARQQVKERPTYHKDTSSTSHRHEPEMPEVSNFNNTGDGRKNVPAPRSAPRHAAVETGPDPKLIWKEIDRAQGRSSVESTAPDLAKSLPELPVQSSSNRLYETAKKEQAGMFGLSYLPGKDVVKPAGKPLARDGEKTLQHRFSFDSDLSFADCGAPDTMEDCLKCGLVPSGAHVLKNGLCAKCTHPAFRDEQQKAALGSSESSIWPRGLGLNRDTTYGDLVTNPFVDSPLSTPHTPATLGVLPEAEVTKYSSYEGGRDSYIPARAHWRRASTSEDVRSQSSRNTAFYGFYDELLPEAPREQRRQTMTRRPTYY